MEDPGFSANPLLCEPDTRKTCQSSQFHLQLYPERSCPREESVECMYPLHWWGGRRLPPELVGDPQTLISMLMPLQCFLTVATKTGKEHGVGGSSQTSSWRHSPSAFHFLGASLRQINCLFRNFSFLLWEMKREGALDLWKVML